MNSVAFSPDSTLLASGSGDKTVILWDMKTRAARTTLRGHDDIVGPVAFSADGARLMAADVSGQIKIWDIKTARELLTLMLIGRDEWVAKAPDGRFDASPGGRAVTSWKSDGKEADSKRIEKQYRAPGLLAKIWMGKPVH